MVTAFDVITMGRIGVDVYPLQTGVSLREVERFGKYLGGSSSNVAVAAARYGRKVATITRTGEDPFGEFLHDALQGFGVDDRYVTPVADLPTPVTFCEIFPPDDFPLYFYRFPKAPDLEIHAHELDLDAIRAAKVFWATVTGLSPGAEPLRDARRAGGRRGHHRARPRLPPDVLGLARGGAQVGARGDPARRRRRRQRGRVATRRTSGPMTPRRSSPSSSAGPKGVLARRGDERVEVPPAPVDVVNGLGAGDAFGGALCHGLLAEWDLERMMRFANAAERSSPARLACADAMPTQDEVEAKLEEAVNA